MPPHILVLHGPNLNLLGTREPDVYGRTTLAELDERLDSLAVESGAELTAFQSNDEGTLVDRIQEAGRDGTAGLLVNAAAYTHTSVAIRDALLAVGLPAVEVHLTNTAAREEFRHRSLIADVVLGTGAGFGPRSYELALQGLLACLEAAAAKT